MRQSDLFTKTSKEAPKDEVAKNAQLLERAGFIYKNSAGIYSYLPLGLRVLQKIAGIIREEMEALGAQEIFMPALIEKKYMESTGRWNVDISIEAKARNEKDASFVLGWSHEDILTAMMLKFINSYKDFPISLYQIQTKFRHEPRAKSGMLRGREFMMKDLYSFHADEGDFKRFYEEVRKAYLKIFERCGIKAIYTVAAGGVFTLANTHEFQIISPMGEDTIFVCKKCGYAENKEICTGGECKKCGGSMEEERAIEVGNIFPLGTKYSEAFNLQYTDKDGSKKYPVMGSYGIGLSRLMGTIVEVHNDENGIIWPKSVAPFDIHLIAIGEDVQGEADKIYEKLQKNDTPVLYDNRVDSTAGEKFADADLIGIPTRMIVSTKTLKEKSVEIKARETDATKLEKIVNL